MIARAEVTAAEITVHGLSAFAERMLKALRQLTKERQQHPCGGFTTDDIEWQLGTAFTPERLLLESIEELSQARLIRYAGYDEQDAIGHCYALTEGGAQ